MKFDSKNLKFNNLSKTVSFVKIFQRELKKIIIILKKVVKNRRFWAIFSTKTRYCSAVVLPTSIKVGFKMKYNCYMLQIQALKKFIWSWWGDMGVRTLNFEKSQKTQLIEETL
jgi:hypothetical protein